MAGFNINQFRQKLRQGGARPTLFRVIVKGSGNVNALFPSEQFSFMCRTSQLPTSVIGSIEVPYWGRKIKIAGDRTFEEWNTSVINDETFDIRNALERWQSGINSLSGELETMRNNGATSSPMSYVTDITVEQYSKEGKVIKTYTLKNAFPIVVGPIELDWESTDTVEVFDVTWSYDYFVTSGVA